MSRPEAHRFGTSSVRWLAPTAAKPRYRILFEDPVSGGTREVGGGHSEPECLKRCQEIADALRGGMPPAAERGRATVETALSIWLDPALHPGWGRVHAGHMLGRAHTHVLPLIGARKVGTLTPDDLRKVLTVAQRNVSPGYVIQVGQLLNQWARWLRAEGFTTRELMRGVEPAAIARPRFSHTDDEGDGEDDALVAPDEIPTPEGVRALVDALEASTQPWWALGAELSAAVGVRLGELMGIDVPAVDLDAATVLIRRTLERPDSGPARWKPTKSRRKRTVPIPPPLLGRLAERIKAVEAAHAAGENPERLLFCAASGGKAHRSNLARRVLAPAMAKAARGGWQPQHTFHSLRHFAATSMLRSGVDVVDLAATLGHESGPGFTMRRYVGFAPGHVERTAAALQSWTLATAPGTRSPIRIERAAEYHGGCGRG